MSTRAITKAEDAAFRELRAAAELRELQRFVIWNGRGNQRVRPWGVMHSFDTPEDAQREWNKFESHLRGCGIVPPHVTIKRIAEVSEFDSELEAAVRGPNNNCE